MPLLLMFVAGAGLGGWGLSQADDAIETVTGERGGIPYLQLGILLVVGYLIWSKVK